MKNRVLQINAVCNSGSTGRIAEGIGKSAIQHGWDSYIAYGRWTNGSSSKEIKIGNKFDQWNHVFLTRLFDRHGLASGAATKMFLKKIDEINPNIIHLHNIHGYYINYKVLFRYLSRKKIPVVWTLHDCWAFTGHCPHFEYIDCERWKTLCGECPLKSLYPSSYGFDRSRQNYLDKKECFTSLTKLIVVPVSDWLFSLASQSFLSCYPMQRIYSGIDLTVFARDRLAKKKLGLDERKEYLLAVATDWDPTKGLDDIISLRDLLTDEYQIIIIGLDRKRRMDLPHGVVGLDRVDINTLALYYSAASVVLNLSYEETFGMTTVEGMACGTPGIVYDATSSPELLDDTTGIIVPTGDLQQVANSVVKLCHDRDKEAMCYFCRNRVERLFDQRERFNEYLLLYEKILSEEL